jgi:hypothetical protein
MALRHITSRAIYVRIYVIMLVRTQARWADTIEIELSEFFSIC